MTDTQTRSATVSRANVRGIMLDGKFTGVSRWAALDTDALTWECKKPDWFEPTVTDLRWAEESGEPRNAIFMGGDAVLLHGYALTLRDAIEDTGASFSFDRFLPGFRVKDPDQYADGLRDICKTYNICVSPQLEGHLDGLDQAVHAVAGTAADALAAGFAVPKDFASGRVLKEHQEDAVLSIAHNGAALLADAVGLGKGGEFVCGLMSLNDYLESKGLPVNYPVVVAVTKSMKLEIAEEIIRWKDDAKIEVLTGGKAASIAADTQFIVVNHDLITKARRLNDILAANPRAFIADEAHVYKNMDTERSKSALKIANAVREASEHPYVVMATGTPFLNNPRELWALIQILGWSARFFEVAREEYRKEHGTTIMRTRVGRQPNHFAGGGNKPGALNWQPKEIWPQRAFETQWCGGSYDQYGAWWNNKATHTAQLNHMLLDAGMIRRRKIDVINPLPPLSEALFRFELAPEVMSHYEEVAEEFRSWLITNVRREAAAVGRNQERAEEYAVRKLMAGEDVMRLTALRAQLSLMKVPHTIEWVHRFMAGEMSTDPSRNKLILYVHHREARDALVNEPTFAKYNPVHILSGAEQSDQSIVDHKRQFQEDPDTRLIICSMAAREGHTLTAAKDVFLHEMPFVPSWIVQMAGRCWARFSEQFEPHEAFLHYSIADNTIDTMLVRMNAVKKAMFTSVIDGEDESASDNDLYFGKPEQGESWDEARDRQGARLLEAFSIGAKELEIAQ